MTEKSSDLNKAESLSALFKSRSSQFLLGFCDEQAVNVKLREFAPALSKLWSAL